MEPTPSPAEHSTTPVASSGTPPSAPRRRLTRRSRLLLALVVVIVGASIAFPRRGAVPVVNLPADGGSERAEPVAAVVPDPVPPAPIVVAEPVAATAVPSPEIVTPPSKPAVPKNKKARIGASSKSAAIGSAATPVADASAKEDAVAVPAAAEPVAALSSTSTVIAGPPPVTITGCLEMAVDSSEFRLTDTEGADVPKARNWRTGFLKKRSAPVLLVEPGDSQTLRTQVGKRVAASGVLTSHELKVSSLRVIGASCD